MANNLPTLTEEQRKASLEKAMAVRKERSERLQQLKNKEMSVTDFLEIDDDITKRTRVLTFLKSLPGIGRAKARSYMAEHGIPENRRIGGLGRIQREEIIEAFSK